jgi:capsular polysaccharide biosynthesis protein
METVAILRVLWSRRRLVAVVLVLALVVGAAMAYRLPTFESRTYQVGVATSRIFVDTPSSQVVEVAPKGGDTLGTRAGLIASLMVDGTIKASIGRRAHLRPGQFDAISESAAETSPAVATPTARSRVLMTRVVTNAAGDDLPIIEIQARAADANQAAALAAAGVSGLRDFLNTKAAQQRVPGAKRLRVNGLGPPQARDLTRGPRRLFALIAAFFVTLAGCAAIVLGSRLAAAWREEPAERLPDVPVEDVSTRPAPPEQPDERHVDLPAIPSAPPERFLDGKRAREAARLGEVSR